MPEPLHRQPGLVRRFSRNRRGVIIIMFALMLPIVVGFIGIGVELVYWFSTSRDLQAAADAAALAGSYELAENRPTQVGTVATREATGNGWDSNDGTIPIRSYNYNNNYPASGNYTTSQDAVEIELTQNVNLMFAGYFMTSAVTINARAVGLSVAGSSSACLLALGSANAARALWVSGEAAVKMSGCVAASNSTDSAGVTTTSGLTVDCVYSAGGVSGKPTTTDCVVALENQSAITDPYEAAVKKPPDSNFDSCGSDESKDSQSGLVRRPKKKKGKESDKSNGEGNSYTASTDDTIDPGVYCGISFLSDDNTLTLTAGTYYIDRGDFTSTGGTIDATAGVTIVFGDSTGAGNCGGISFTGNSNVYIIAQPSGNFSGLAFYRSSDCDAKEEFKIAGSNDSAIIGAVYNPSGAIKITGNGDVASTCLQLIADTIKVTGNSNINNSCDSVGTQTISTSSKGSLVE